MAKWIRNQYDKALTYEKLMNSHKRSKSGKGLRREVILFSLKEEEYIEYLYEKLKTGTYIHGKYSAFKVYEPKERIIEKAPYIDRIVHRWVVDNFLIPYYVPSFINTTYACIKGKRNASSYFRFTKSNAKKKNIQRILYFKKDVRKFFNSIDKKILYKILKKRIKDEKLLWLIRQILSAQERQKGIEIGNYTSQTFANIYLNELDQYATRKLKIKNYYRYMDDIVILARNKNEAKEYLNEIKEFLQKKLELELNDKTNIFKAKQGVNFCGYKINEYRLKVRNKGKNKFKKKVKNLLKEIKEGNISSKDARQYLTGHLGYFEIANTYNLKQKNIFLQDELLRKNIINQGQTVSSIFSV